MYAILIAAFLLVPLFYSKKKFCKTLGLVIFCSLLCFISAFRGNFTADYINYCNIYRLFAGKDISVLFDPNYDKVFYVERGFGLLNIILARFFYNPQAIIIATSIIIVFVYFMLGKKVEDKFLYVLLLINIGSYFQSFNITRQILAACIFMFSYTFVQEKKFFKYCLTVLLATTFHVSSIIMLPFYWMLRWKISLRNTVMQILITSVTLYSFDSIMSFMDGALFDDKYAVYEVFGDAGIQTVVVPLAICLFVVAALTVNTVSVKKGRKISVSSAGEINEKLQENAILYNGTIYWMLTYFMAMRYFYLYRFSAYFCMFAVMAVVKSADSIKSNSTRAIIKGGMIILLSIYYIFFGQYFGNYVFCF